MRKYIFTIVFLLIFTVNLMGWPMFVFAAPNTVSIDTDTSVDIWGSGKTLTLKSGGEVAGFSVYSTYLSVNLESGSQLTVVSSDGYVLISDIGVPVCDSPVSGQSQVYLSSTTTQTVTVTPSTTNCSARISGGSGGGGGSSTTTTTTTTTTNAQTTATASGGGTTTLTTGDNSTATAELPANAVASSTDIKITAENKTEVAYAQPAPSGKSIVGNYVYNFTATSGGISITTFLKDVTLVFTYTDSQISGLNEDSLKAYYWEGSKWTALTGTLDKANNKITVLTNHFTYFAIMGDTTTTTMAKPSDYGLKEGDLIRAEGDFDIFIISQYGYKRLFLNPTIFNMYGHLGGWKAVKTVSTATRDAFITSHYYRYVDSSKVYQMKVTGEDTGTLHWINMTAEDFLAQGGKGEAIFIINKSELDWYSKGADVNSLK